jgi:molybdopterin-biosynthesis enzyme MoeA-like protein
MLTTAPNPQATLLKWDVFVTPGIPTVMKDFPRA